MPQDVKQAQAELMSALLTIDRYPAAAELLGATTVVLDANFCEQFLHTVYRWDERRERQSAQIRRAFAYIQTFRYRTAADYLAMPAAIELVRSIAAHQSTEAMFAFVSQISETFDANVVEALFAAPYYLGSADDETQSFLEGLGRDAAQGLRLKLAHRPPRLYRFFVTQLFGAYQQNQMLDLLRERIWMVDTALAATVTVVLESMRARDELTDEHIHFAASLATRVEQLSSADHSVELEFVAADLCENLAVLCAAGQDNDGQANMLRKVGLLRGARSPTLAAVYLRAALAVPDVSSELRIGLSCALAEQLIDARGDSGANVEEAISWLKLAEQLANSSGASASVRAIVQNEFGDAFRYRVAGSRRQNLTIAAGCFRQAMEICPAEVDAYPYAQAVANLGAVLGESDELATVLRGIELIEESLTLTDQSAADFGLNLLEEAKLHMSAHELGADGHVTAALAAVESAMQLPAIQQVPSYLAAALVCYGSVVLRLPVLPADAEDMLRRAVEVADVLPGRRESAATARLYLGRFYMARGDLAAARSNLSGAIQDFEADVGPETGVEERTAVERRVSEAYTALIDVLVALGEPKAAFDCLERSKARTLGDMIAAREILPGSGVPSTLVEDYIQLRERQRYAEKRAQMMRFGSRPDAQETRPGQSDYVIRMADVEVAMQQQVLADLEPRLAAVVQAIQAHDPAFTPAPRHAPLALADIQHLLAPDRAIVELLLAEHRTYLFVLTPGSDDEATLTVFEAPRANRTDVRALVQSGWLEPYQRYRSAALSGSPQLKKLRAEWQSAIASLGPRLAELLDFAEVSRFLARTQIKDIIFVPYQLFHILPLHLLPGDRGGYLCDEYAISYAPSLEILKACHHRAHRGRSSGLLVENPDGSLDYSALEVGLVRSFLQRSQRLAGDDCRWEDVQSALPGTEIFHYSGHAYFDLRSPLNSALMLADRRLTLGEIMTSSDLSASALVVLSACETNQVTPFLPGDEYEGLPSGFLYAGAATVLGTLWVVEDVAGPLLMHEFYRQFVGAGVAPGEALAAALKRLRTLSAADVIAEFGTPGGTTDMALDRLLTICRLKPDQSAPLFEHPEYWAAFTLVGRA